jgi:tetratricopeptide (TPR) repeat protein
MTRRKTPQETTSPSRRQAKSRSSADSAGGPGVHSINRNKWTALLGVLLAAATIALYSPVIGFPFLVIDDTDYVTSNLHVHGGLSWSTVKWAFTAFTAANWHPVTWLSHALDYQLFALNPAGHHFDSVLIHALNAVLLFLVLRWLTGRKGPSLLVAALFAWHPINVESVAWVAERKNVLSTFFFLAAIGAYGWYARNPRWQRYVAVAALFALGLMAKPMVITLPFVLLLLDYWPLGRTPGSEGSAVGAAPAAWSKLVLEKIPLLAMSAASALVTIKAQRSGYAVRSLHQFSFAARVENAAVAYCLYLWKMVWPAHLAFGYPHAASSLPAWQWILSGSVLAGISTLVVFRQYVLRRDRFLLVGWLWFLGMLVPVIGLVQVGDAAMADRYAYLPLIGIFIMIAFGAAELADRIRIRKSRLTWMVASGATVLIPLLIVTHIQMGYWDSEFDLWTHALAATEENPFAHDALGAALMDPEATLSPGNMANFGTSEARMEEARRQLERALAMRRELARENPETYLPDMAVTLNNLANLERMENNVDAARRYYEEGLQIHSQLAQKNLDPYPGDRAQALLNLAYLERSKLENDKALAHFEGALKVYRELAQGNPDQYLPSVAEALNGLAVTERDEKRMDTARRDYEEALQIRRALAKQNASAYMPYLAMTLNDLGILDGMENRSEDARRHYEEALKFYRQLVAGDPETYSRYLAGTLNNLAFLYQNQGRLEESRADYQEALGVYQKLYRADPNGYANDVARVEASLRDLEKRGRSSLQ